MVNILQKTAIKQQNGEPKNKQKTKIKQQNGEPTIEITNKTTEW